MRDVSDVSMMSGRLLFFFGFVGVASGALGIQKAQAQPAGAPLAVLGLEATDGAPSSVANTITDALRQKVANAKGFKLVPGKDIMEVKLVFSCPDEAPSCMAQAAKSLGAEKLIFGSVKRAADGYLVTLKMLDASKARVDAWVAEQIARTQATGPGVRGPVQKWFATLTGAGASGTVRVTSDVVGASVLLDGLPVGVTMDEPLELGGIATGRHEIVVSKPGYEPVRRDVDVVGGEVVSLTAPLDAVAPAAAPPQGGGEALGTAETVDVEESDGMGMKIATWSTLGAGALALALGVKFSLDVRQADSDLDPLRRFPCEGAAPAARPACNEAGEPVGALSPAERQEAQRILDDAEGPKTLQWVFYGTSAALLGTGLYLYYKTYASPGDPDGGDLALAKRIRMAPVLTPGGGGVSARLSF